MRGSRTVTTEAGVVVDVVSMIVGHQQTHNLQYKPHKRKQN